MDANGLRFWMLANGEDWLPPGGSSDLAYCSTTKRLALRSVRNGPPLSEDFATTSALLENSPMASDGFGNYARWDSTAGHVMAGGAAAGEVPIYTPLPLQHVSDLGLGEDGILYVAVGGTLVLVDRRDRWPNATLAIADFNFWRLLPLHGGGVLALDRANAQLGLVTGQPQMQLPMTVPDPDLLRTCQGNLNPPRIASRIALNPSESWVALSATSDPAQVALLSWSSATPTNQAAWLRLISLEAGNAQIFSIPNLAQAQATAGFSAPIPLGEVRFPYSVAALENMRFAVLASNTNEALIYDLSGFSPANPSTAATPAGESYILAATNAGPFAHRFDLPPYYTSGTGILPLLPLSLNAFAASGTTTNQRVIDSGNAQATWHRLFLEAVVPQRTGMIVWLAAADKSEDLAGDNVQWYPHVAGSLDMSTYDPETPRAVWLSTASEVAFAKPLLSDNPVPERSGLFMTLIQRVGTTVRSLQGRYLAVKLVMFGDRRSTPQLAALRVYASRFSYVQQYLPELYREDTFGPDADAPGPSTRPDFFERFVNIFETQLTRMEDRVSQSYLLTRPESTPDASLDWLGGWIGIRPGTYPPGRRRARLLATSKLYKERGSVQGIIDAIDVATDGLCTRGAVIVIEDFRLRHTFATILGADLSISNNPLLPGYSASSNSFVGDTLFLGNPYDKEFLSLYDSDILTAAEQQSVEQFYDALAHRISVFVHDQVETVDLGLISTILDEEKPAHVAATIRRATQGLMIGLASLVGVNTYLGPVKQAGVATVGESQIGRYDVITHLASLDPRLENDPSYSPYTLPIARIGGPGVLIEGQTQISLDGSASTASPEDKLTQYQWTMQQVSGP